MRHPIGWILCASVLPCWSVACGGGDDSSSVGPQPSQDAGGDVAIDGSGGTGGSGGSGGGGGTSGTGGTGGSEDCPSGLYCGMPASCCDPGQECSAGSCIDSCASGVRCGADCCLSDQVCLELACVAPGIACKDSFDCAEDEFCEPTLGACLPQPTTGPACEYRPPPLPFDPILEWSWTGSTIAPDYDQVLSIPLVADLDGDSIPEVVIVTHDRGDGACDTGFAYVRALDGRTGVEKWPDTAEAYTDAARVAFCRTPAIADIDGDGHAEIVAPRFGGGLLALRADGSLAWSSTAADGVTPYTGYFPWATAVAIAHMDSDGTPEIVAGGVVFDATGRVRSGTGEEAVGKGNSIVADINGDGKQEVLSGNAALAPDGTVVWQSGDADGYPAIADFDTDGVPELVVISAGTARVHNATTGALLASSDMPGAGNGGPPTISDFDGDGAIDFASAVGDSYTIFRYASSPAPAISVLWSAPTLDISSSQTGSSVFDFDGDDASEVLYNDECYLRVYNGKTGDVLFETASSSGTASLYPVAVDVDGDHNTELVVASDDKYQIAGMTPGCPQYEPGQELRHGVFVYGDNHDKWVRTRAVWNQHSYHITNIGADGVLPEPEALSWGPAGFNNYRVSSPGSGAYNAPDLVLDLAVLVAGCPATVTLRASVGNLGSLGVPAGVTVSFYSGSSASPAALLGEGTTTQDLLPGQQISVDLTVPVAGTPSPYSFFAVVDGADPAQSTVDECHEDNNTATIDAVTCPAPK